MYIRQQTPLGRDTLAATAAIYSGLYGTESSKGSGIPATFQVYVQLKSL